ncbi:MAG TPA: DUF2807 domain-containing protein [Solirubrobacteraceae bacterium]|nr:DUF2807 domain-containing protein [Solirubrobacteraceae bacterium]
MLSPRPLIPFLAAGVVAVAIAGCAIGDDGPRVSQTRDVAGFTRVDNQGSVDLRLHAGEPQRVLVLAGEKVIDDVRTEVRDGTLHVSFDHHGFGGGDVAVEATVRRLAVVEASGSGDVDADGVDAGSLDVRSDGSADIAVQGAARQLTLDLSGSGDADLGDLDVRDAQVTISGSGDAVLRADRLAQQVDGSGELRRAQ